MSVEPMDVTDVIGKNGRWQKGIFVMCMLRGIPTAWHTLVLPLLAPKMDYWCVTPDGLSSDDETFFGRNSSLDRCTTYETFSQDGFLLVNTNKTLPCKQWNYDTSEYESSLISEWDLVCGREWMVSLCQTVYMVSMMVSVFVFGQMADKIGRRPVILINCTFFIAGSLATSFSPSFVWFNVFRAVLGFGAAGLQTTTLCSMMEMVGPKQRLYVGVVFTYGWNFGLMVLPGIAYLLRDWRHLQLAISVPSLFLLLFFCLFPESPRWLLSTGRDERARDLIERVVRINKRSVGNMDLAMKSLQAKVQKGSHTEEASFLDLLRAPTLRRNSFALFVAFFTAALIYYAISLGATDLGGSPFLNFFISAAIETTNYPLAWFVQRFTSRRNAISFFFFMSGTMVLFMMGPLSRTDDSFQWALIMLSTLGKMFISAAFMLIMILAGEVFPTVVRTVGTATCWVFARVGSSVAPFASDIARVSHVFVPQAIFGVMALVAAGAILFLPNSLHQVALQDTVWEVEEARKVEMFQKAAKATAKEQRNGAK